MQTTAPQHHVRSTPPPPTQFTAQHMERTKCMHLYNLMHCRCYLDLQVKESTRRHAKSSSRSLSTRSQRTNSNDGAYYTIDQFKTFRINQVADGSGNIPSIAFKTRINVPPPGEIKISTSGALSVNSFSNNFMTFDNANNTFDESVDGTNTRATSGGIYTSFDENAVKFDSSTATFDIGS